MNGGATAAEAGPVAILCGGGSFPYTVADAVIAQGRRAVLFALKGFADPEAVQRYPHYWAHIGQFGRFVKLANREGCRDVVFIGTLVRPAVRELRLDWTTLKLMPRIARQFYGGDDHLLSGVARIFEDHGFRLLGAHEIAPQILMPEGTLGRCRASEANRADMTRGFAVLRATGAFDIGQAVVVAGNNVLALEAAEGTDLMLARVRDLRAQGRIRVPAGTGVLVKAPKPNQDRRFDLPSIGPRTVEGVRDAGLAGIAVVAGETIVAEPQAIVEIADRTGLFVEGCSIAAARRSG